MVITLLLILILLPLLLLLAPVFFYILRNHERSEPEIDEHPGLDHLKKLAEQEDHEVVNQFTVIGSVKAGWFRRGVLSVALTGIDFFVRYFFTRGKLARISTIHFARWVYLNHRRRVLFASNYDGSRESYNDDFINKVGFGLNIAFSSGLGYPKTRYLLFDGAWQEQKFKRILQRHQITTDTWYHAYPGLTAANLATNTRIREGLEKPQPCEAKAKEWLRLFV